MKASTFVKGVKRMSNKDKQKSELIKDAEAQNGETHRSEEAVKTEPKPLAADACTDCKGEGISDPQDHQVCQTCEGSGKA
jgi:DnaJ-class molecular chaperone